MKKSEGKEPIEVGCCGFSRAQGTYWRHFSLIEIQQTFYRPPRMATAIRWREEAPDNFRFTLKAWQLITHPPSSPTYRRLGHPIAAADREKYGFFRPTEEVMAAWRTTEAIASALRAPVIVFQCPASFQPTPENEKNLLSFFSAIDRKDFLLGWEPRGKWEESTIKRLCRQADLIHVVDPFRNRQISGEVAYYRLHGIGGYRYRYTAGDLKMLENMIPPGRDTYCLFNNTSMWEDALRFQDLLGEKTGREKRLP